MMTPQCHLKQFQLQPQLHLPHLWLYLKLSSQKYSDFIQSCCIQTCTNLQAENISGYLKATCYFQGFLLQAFQARCYYHRYELRVHLFTASSSDDSSSTEKKPMEDSSKAPLALTKKSIPDLKHLNTMQLQARVLISNAGDSSITPAQFQQYITSAGVSVFNPRACSEDRPFKCLCIFGPPRVGKSDAASGMNAFIQGTQITTTSKNFYKFANEESDLFTWQTFPCDRRSSHLWIGGSDVLQWLCGGTHRHPLYFEEAQGAWDITPTLLWSRQTPCQRAQFQQKDLECRCQDTCRLHGEEDRSIYHNAWPWLARSRTLFIRYKKHFGNIWNVLILSPLDTRYFDDIEPFWTPCIFSILSSPLRYNQAAYYASGWYHWLSSFDVRTKLHNHASSWYNLTFKPRCQNEWFPFEVLDMTRHAKRCTCIQVFFVCQMSGTCSGYWWHIPTSSFTAQFHYIIGISSQPWVITVRVTLAKVEQQMENLQEIPVIYYRYLFLHLYEEHGVWTPYSRGATGVPEDTTTVEPNSTSILDMLRRLRSRSPPRNQTEDATPSTTPPTSRPPIFLPGTFGLQPDVERASMALETAIVSALQVAPPHLVRAHTRLILTHHLPRTPISERLAQFAANV